MLGNQIVFTPSIKVISFSKYLSFHLGVVIGHANWANLIEFTRLLPRKLYLVLSLEFDKHKNKAITDVPLQNRPKQSTNMSRRYVVD